jgi:death-on-curing protein
VIYLSLSELLYVAERTMGTDVPVRDHGLLESELARPQATAFGEDAYAGLDEKAAALLHSLARNHALVDGNQRLALAATIALLGLNGRRLTLTNNQAYELIMDVAAGHVEDVRRIAERIRAGSEPRRPRSPATAICAGPLTQGVEPGQ